MLGGGGNSSGGISNDNTSSSEFDQTSKVSDDMDDEIPF